MSESSRRAALEEVAEVSPLLPASRFPLLVQSRLRTAPIVAFGKEHQQVIRELLLQYGALLFRGFQVERNTFGPFTDEVSGERLEYVYRSTPRHAVGARVFTATIYPANREIPLHCEEAYKREWPMTVAFYCEQAAQRGGETPLADVFEVTNRLDPALLNRFRTLGVRYVRNYRQGIDLPWTDVFQTTDRAEVNRYCAEQDIRVLWRDDDSLQTSQVCQGTAVHPLTGREVFFNQAHLFHVSSQGEEMAREMTALFGPEGLPRNTFYGNGEPLGSADLAAVRAAFEAETRSFPWQEGDVLLVDNMQIAHGRRSYSGPRVVLVTMANPHGKEMPV